MGRPSTGRPTGRPKSWRACRYCLQLFGQTDHYRHQPHCPERPQRDTSKRFCRGCGETKELDAFALSPTSSDGRRSQCKACRHDRYMELHGNEVKARREAAIVNPSGLCECGCGQPTSAPWGKKHKRFIFRHQSFLRRSQRLEAESGLKQKQCGDCGKTKPLSDFHRDKKRGIYFTNCRLCVNEATQVRFEKNRDAKLEKNREWYRKNQAKRGKQTAAWRRAHPEKLAGYARRWRLGHLDQARAYAKEYARRRPEVFKNSRIRRQTANPEKFRAQYQQSRARRAGTGGHYSASQWCKLLADCGHRCVDCGVHQNDIRRLYPGRRIALEHDHIIPINSGGSSWIWNMQPLCPRCNNRKRAKSIDYRPRHVREKYAEPLNLLED